MTAPKSLNSWIFSSRSPSGNCGLQPGLMRIGYSGMVDSNPFFRTTAVSSLIYIHISGRTLAIPMKPLAFAVTYRQGSSSSHTYLSLTEHIHNPQLTDTRPQRRSMRKSEIQALAPSFRRGIDIMLSLLHDRKEGLSVTVSNAMGSGNRVTRKNPPPPS